MWENIHGTYILKNTHTRIGGLISRLCKNYYKSMRKRQTSGKGAETLTGASQKRRFKGTMEWDKMLNLIRIQGHVNYKPSEMSLDF